MEIINSKTGAMKCIVRGCKNFNDGGVFVGDLCAPCYEMITTGMVHNANPTFIGDLKRQVNTSEEKIRTMILMGFQRIEDKYNQLLKNKIDVQS